MFPSPTRRALASVALLASAALTLAGCTANNSADDNANDSSQGSSAAWPRTFENADGTTTEIPEQPEQIVSTSVTVSGTLLAIDAPLVASGSAGNGEFFAQWDDIAKDRDVANLWAASAPDIEAIYNYTPDLIVVSASGADSTADIISELQQIAPTILVDYGGQTWESLAEELGEATGLEDQAAKTITEFDDYVASASEKITVPSGSANIISFNGPGEDNPIARAGSVHGDLLESLGFTIEDPNPEWHTQDNLRQDFVWTAYEHLVDLKADTTFILMKDNEGAKAFASDPVLANVPSVQNGQVFGLGVNSFRVDKFSATEIVDDIVTNFSK